MTKRYFLVFWLLSFPFYGAGSGAVAQNEPQIRVSVVLVH